MPSKKGIRHMEFSGKSGCLKRA